MAVHRPSWFPPRIDWFPGEDEDSIGFTIREGCAPDFFALRAICRAAGVRPNARLLYRWLGAHGFTVRVAARNHRHLAAACISKHHPSGSEILVCHVWPEYRTQRLEQRLLMCAALELPEASLTWVIDPAMDETRAARLVDMGWTFHGAETDDAGHEKHRYVHSAIVSRRDAPACPSDCT